MLFEKVKCLGRGGFGEVWLARTQHAGKLIAVKYLINTTPEHVRLLWREARNLWRQAENEHVVRLIGLSRPKENPYLILEYCSGGSLREWVTKPRPWRAVAIAIAQACRGLAAIHAVGGFHRDVKPDNILIGRSRDKKRNIAKLSDLGLARVPATGGSRVTCSPRGTPAYMSPETKRGEDFSPASDIWSMGATTWELLTGSLARKRLRDVRAPRDLLRLTQEMLDPDPGMRPVAKRIAEEIHELLDEWQ